MEKRFVYADNAATTNVSKEVLDAMLPYLTEHYGNPSSIYAFANAPKLAIEHAREQVAVAINADPREIFFTSGGSESDNWAIKGVAHMMAKKGKRHIISSAFEHHAVLHTLNSLEKEGFEITLLPVHANGIVRVDELEAAIREDTALVTIMYANNEIGTIQPISEIGEVCKAHGVYFHTDAVQAFGNQHIDVRAQNIDMLSISGHKIHAPKGVGALYCRKNIRLPNLIDGGAQERGRRAGTENVAGIVGLGVAAEKAASGIDDKIARLTPLRDKLLDFASSIERSHINGDREHRLCGNFNVSFEGVEGESLLLLLDMNGISASSGSACTSGSLDPSHVLLSLGLPHEVAHGSLRISLGDDASDEDIDYIISVLPGIITRLRSMSPLWEHIINGEVSF